MQNNPAERGRTKARTNAVVQSEYLLIRDECAIVTASDSKHSPYLVNAIASMKDNFVDHPKIIVYNIGLRGSEQNELRQIDGVELRPMPAFVSHWRLNWSWKLFALTHDLPRYTLYLDLPNFVVLRSLASWFACISRNSYLVISNGQHLGQITPSEYWSIYGLSRADIFPTFGAGIIGFDRQSKAYEAIQLAFNGVYSGLNLGRSQDERNFNYKPDLIRDCACFRADQTVLNLSFRRIFKSSLLVRKNSRYCGDGTPDAHPSQYLWYARRTTASLTYINRHLTGDLFSYMSNRIFWKLMFISRRFVNLVLGNSRFGQSIKRTLIK
jgi:hypothetical protein